ncbi:MAG: SIS domain-containing protein [Desulfovibrionales bacterium]
MNTPANSSPWVELAREVLDTEIQGLEMVRDSLDGGFTAALELIAVTPGRVVITGVGKSGLVGRKIAATLSSTGTPSFFLHPVEGAHGDMGMLRAEDVVLAISNSGETDELNCLIPSLRTIGVKIIAMSGNPKSSLARASDVFLCCKVPREACPHGLAPTASTTAALALGDALAVCLIRWKSFEAKDFQKYHPGGALGQRLAMTISELMHRDALPVVTTGTTLHKALEVMNQGGLGTVLVVDADQRLQGIFTDGDVRRMICRGETSLDRVVDEVMIPNPLSAEPSQKAGEVMDILEAKGITVMPIVDGSGLVIGIIHLHDLLGKGKYKFSRFSKP